MIAIEEQHPAEPAPATLSGFYAELRALAEQGLSSPHDLGLAERIEALVQRLPELRESLAEQEAESLRSLVGEIADLGKGIGISDFEDQGFVAAFGYA